MTEGDDPYRCRHPGCPWPRTRLSVFCEEHHQLELEKAETRANTLSWRQTISIWAGPISVNLLRIAVAAAGTILIGDPNKLLLQLLLLTALTVPIAWRFGTRIIHHPWPRSPTVHFPGLTALIPMTLMAFAIPAVVVIAVELAMRLVG